jgi:Tol biopolymer transport system component
MKTKTKKLFAIVLLLAISISLIMTYLSLPPRPLEDLTQRYDVTRLTTSPADDRNLVWSPDGSKIFFKSDSYICVMDSDGSNVTKLAEGRHATLSPDGSKIFYRQIKEGLYQAGVMNADGSRREEIAELTFIPSVLTTPLLYSWSPDRTKIVYLINEPAGYGLQIENGSYVRSEHKVEPGDKEWPFLESITTLR